MIRHFFRKFLSIVRAITFVVLLLIAHNTAFAEALITGVILDISTRQPLPDANVIIQGDSLHSSTDEHGRFEISGLPPGKCMVEASHVGYRDQSKTVVLSDLTEKHLTIFLEPISILVDGITVTANRMEQMNFSAPISVSTTSAETFPERNVSSTADILREEPAVMVQKTTHGHGAPVLRGLIGKHVLLLYDGIRLNKSTFRFGANQYLNTIDLNSLSRVEVVRGPSSVMYGSDAIGGVVNLVPRRVPESSGRLSLTTEACSRYSSADHGRTFHAAVGARTQTIWLALDGAYKKIGDLRAGRRIGIQDPTGWEETDFGGQIAVDLARQTQLRLDYLGVRQQRVPRYDKYVSGEFEEYIYDPQDRDMLSLSFESKLIAPAIHSLKCGVAWQRETEGRSLRRTGLHEITESLDEIETWGGHVQMSSHIRTRHWLSYGFELHSERIGSSRTEISGTARIEIRPTFPDDSRYRSVGIFAQDEFSVVPDVTLTAGVRYSHIVLESLLESPHGEIKDSYGDVTGSLALTCMLSNDLNLIGSWSRGFRAPNLNDVVVLKESSSGVDAPSIGLAPEKSNNFELGAKLRTDQTRGSLFFYYNILSDMIDRKPGTYDGKPYIDLNDNGEQDSDEPDVFQRQNVGRSRIYGVEFDASAKLTDMFETKCNCFWTYGKNLTDDEPLSRIPPIMGMLALRMDVSKKHWVEFYLRAATSQRRLSQRDIDDSRIEENGTPSWVTLNLRAGIDLGDLNLNLGFENLADATYKEHGSGVYSPGRNMTLTLTYGLH